MPKKRSDSCPKCHVRIPDPSADICPECWADLPRPKTDAMDQFPVSLEWDPRLPIQRRRRKQPRHRWEDQVSAMDALQDYARLVERRQSVRFLVRVYRNRKPPRAELYQLVAKDKTDPRGLGGAFQRVRTVAPGEIPALEAEAERLNGRPLDPGELIQETILTETRGRPAKSKFQNDWQRDAAAYYAGHMTREAIQAKYSKNRRCPECGAFLPDAWKRQECSPACYQRAYLAHRKRKK